MRPGKLFRIRLTRLALALLLLGSMLSGAAMAQSPTAKPATQIRIDGSSSMAALNQLLKQRFESQTPGVAVQIATNGSDAALAALLRDDVDLAAVGRLLTSEEKAQGLVAVPVRREKIAIIIGPNNPFAGDVTFDQFARLFRGEIRNWSELGGPDVPLRFIDRPESSDTRRAFRGYPVFQNAPFQAGSSAQPVATDDTEAVIQALGDDGIGYAIADQVLGRDTVKIVPMHQTLPDDPRYPFSQPLVYVHKTNPSPRILSFLGLASQALAVGAPEAGAATPNATGAPPPQPIGIQWWGLVALVAGAGLFWRLGRKGSAPASGSSSASGPSAPASGSTAPLAPSAVPDPVTTSLPTQLDLPPAPAEILPAVEPPAAILLLAEDPLPGADRLAGAVATAPPLAAALAATGLIARGAAVSDPTPLAVDPGRSLTDSPATAALLKRKQTEFVLWRPGHPEVEPRLLIGSVDQPIEQYREIPLQPDPDFPELWRAKATDCHLAEGKPHYYWFKIGNTNPYHSASPNQVIYATDPLAFGIDRGMLAPVPTLVPEGKVGVASGDPAGVILYQNGRLYPCDPDGRVVDWDGDPEPGSLPPNNQIVIYELPTRWIRPTQEAGLEIGDGTFQDVLALLVPEHTAPTFRMIPALEGRAHVLELGANALQLLPPADSEQKERWGYGTSNYFAADYDLGFPAGQADPSASFDLVQVIKTCHQNRIRFFKDAVMAFSWLAPLRNLNFLDFHNQLNTPDPELLGREGSGGDLFKLAYLAPPGYDPLTGKKSEALYPARAYLQTYLDHWLTYYRIDGLRFDSIRNVHNYDFIQEAKDRTRSVWQQRGGSDATFLVVGECIPADWALLRQNRLDALWNEDFKALVKAAVLGRGLPSEPSFEAGIRKMIDCRHLGYKDCAQAVNYLSSHDVEGPGNERLYDYLDRSGIVEKEPRIKLAFVCLLTSVGIPMILAGDEFADQMDLDVCPSTERTFHKQVDPVNYERLQDPWRRRVFDYVARLVKFRTQSAALCVNDTEFLHVDFEEGKRVLVWQRGRAPDLVVVVANFSDWATHPDAVYTIPHWPALPSGRRWREITQAREVPSEWAGHEPLYPWEAKVYAAVDSTFTPS